jgi:hypothetical protein
MLTSFCCVGLLLLFLGVWYRVAWKRPRKVGKAGEFSAIFLQGLSYTNFQSYLAEFYGSLSLNFCLIRCKLEVKKRKHLERQRRTTVSCLECMKKCIMEVMNCQGPVTMWDFVDQIDGFIGEWDFFSLKNTRLFYWRGLSAIAIEAMKELLAEDKIVFERNGGHAYKVRWPDFAKKQHSGKMRCGCHDYTWHPVLIYKPENWNPMSLFDIAG